MCLVWQHSQGHLVCQRCYGVHVKCFMSWGNCMIFFFGKSFNLFFNILQVLNEWMNDIQTTYHEHTMIYHKTTPFQAFSKVKPKAAPKEEEFQSLPFVKRLELMDLIRIFPGASATAQVQSQTCTQVGTENLRFCQWIFPVMPMIGHRLIINTWKLNFVFGCVAWCMSWILVFSYIIFVMHLELVIYHYVILTQIFLLVTSLAHLMVQVHVPSYSKTSVECVQLLRERGVP